MALEMKTNCQICDQSLEQDYEAYICVYECTFCAPCTEERQEKPHAHYAGYTPDEKYVVGVDLGIDKIITYEVKDSTLIEVNSLSVNPGSGPRHIAFHQIVLEE